MEQLKIFEKINQNRYLKNNNYLSFQFTNLDKKKINNNIVNILYQLKTLYDTSIEIYINNTYSDINDNIIDKKKQLNFKNNSFNIIDNNKRPYFLGDKNDNNRKYFDTKIYTKKINDVYVLNYHLNEKKNDSSNNILNDNILNDNNLLIKLYDEIDIYSNELSNEIYNQNYYIEYKIPINNNSFNKNKNYISIKQYINNNKTNNFNNNLNNNNLNNYNVNFREDNIFNKILTNKNTIKLHISLIFEILEENKILDNKLKHIKKIVNDVFFIFNHFN
tara:strand:- start:2377 stop:3204 length:828 start_codon:yes stop_codon:yes gene_type:complete